MSYIIIIFKEIPCYIWMKGIRNLSETPYRMRRCSRSIRHVHFNAVLYVCCDALQHTLVNVAPMCEWENSIQRLRGTYIYTTQIHAHLPHTPYTHTHLYGNAHIYLFEIMFSTPVLPHFTFSLSLSSCAGFGLRFRFLFRFVLYFYVYKPRSFVRSFIIRLMMRMLCDVRVRLIARSPCSHWFERTRALAHTCNSYTHASNVAIIKFQTKH